MLLALLLTACGPDAPADAGADADAAADAGADADAAADAGADAAAGADAGADAAADADAGADAAADAATPADAGTCDPSAVRFVYLARGPLEVGTLCDEVFVCVADAAEAARVTAAASVFDCAPTPEAPCPGYTCAYRDPGGPSVLDEAELASICAVTLVTPTPDVVCAVYGG